MPIDHADLNLTAAIFDMDGVITDTAELHFMSWKETFDQFFLKESCSKVVRYLPFTKEDYLKYVDGVMRDDGIKNFLRSREYFPDDEKEQNDLINRLGKEKDESFLKKISEFGVKYFDSTVDLIKYLKNDGVKVAVISSSKYCGDILKEAKVFNLFDAVVSGQSLIEKSIPGKPDPGIFLEAARLLNEPSENCLVVEDALSGVKAGETGHFGLVIGIDRNKIGVERYKEVGADLVVNDLGDLPLDYVRRWFGPHDNSNLQ